MVAVVTDAVDHIYAYTWKRKACVGLMVVATDVVITPHANVVWGVDVGGSLNHPYAYT